MNHREPAKKFKLFERGKVRGRGAASDSEPFGIDPRYVLPKPHSSPSFQPFSPGFSFHGMKTLSASLAIYKIF
jgi:hypothetical protein